MCASDACWGAGGDWRGAEAPRRASGCKVVIVVARGGLCGVRGPGLRGCGAKCWCNRGASALCTHRKTVQTGTGRTSRPTASKAEHVVPAVLSNWDGRVCGRDAARADQIMPENRTYWNTRFQSLLVTGPCA